MNLNKILKFSLGAIITLPMTIFFGNELFANNLSESCFRQPFDISNAFIQQIDVILDRIVLSGFRFFEMETRRQHCVKVV